MKVKGANMLGLLNDKEIYRLCVQAPPMIFPFQSEQRGKPSYGLGSAGYDITLGNTFLSRTPTGTYQVIDPLNIDERLFTKLVIDGDSFVLGAHEQVLAETVEAFYMPEDVVGVCWGKSTYARCGLLVNVTPLEPGWNGVLTVELANVSGAAIRLHIGQGIAQIVFFGIERPGRTYAEKESGGIYQDQVGVTLPQ